MVFLDTSALIAGLSEAGPGADLYFALVKGGIHFGISTLVLYEWQRGKRTALELDAQRRLLPDAAAVAFTHRQAELSAQFYRTLPRARARIMDFCIAACAVVHESQLWTLNERDFTDIPGLRLFIPAL